MGKRAEVEKEKDRIYQELKNQKEKEMRDKEEME